MEPRIDIARVHDPNRDGRARLLVDRLWPRGVRKDALGHDDWIPEIAPSTALREWFAHDPDRWEEFGARYRAELDANPQVVARCLRWCRAGPVTLLYAARGRAHNHALVLRDHLGERLRQEESTP